MGEKGAWLSTEPFEPGDEPPSPENLKKTKSMAGVCNLKPVTLRRSPQFPRQIA